MQYFGKIIFEWPQTLINISGNHGGSTTTSAALVVVARSTTLIVISSCRIVVVVVVVVELTYSGSSGKLLSMFTFIIHLFGHFLSLGFLFLV